MLKIISPVDGSIYAERAYASSQDIQATLQKASAAQRDWKLKSIAERGAICTKAVDAFIAQKDRITQELAWQMGRPIRFGAGEVGGFEERARYMISIAEDSLKSVDVGPKDGFVRYIKREPVGVVLTIAPWNFPFMTAVNSIVPALMSGNAVILKHAQQTLLCAERIADAFTAAGLPDGLFQVLHMSHDQTAEVIQSPEINHVCFTGSVPAGEIMEKNAAGRFIGMGLELGGKDPAYVCADANVSYSAENLVDGAFFNTGQSCCGIERIYVHASVYDDFVEKFVEVVRGYVLGSPLEQQTTLGPLVTTKAANFVRSQIDDALKAGAKALIDTSEFAMDQPGTPYMAPQVLVDVDHSMRVMTEESFGPVVGIMKVKDDDEAVELMNDSEFGLTASIWTTDTDKAIKLGDRIDTGTLFMNRCDYLDPALAWTGVKNTGRGCTLSSVGYESLTRPKSYHLRVDLA
ncbi:MAG: aldehyde dehydrogenase family protein [Rhodospirillales bacterium]|jgi:acyl-CoA reductase-like NAD-dependent aldehyde dehydrogenase|nr:aldehyde dehydrogenase family protein [Rhodospirillales bacterium]